MNKFLNLNEISIERLEQYIKIFQDREDLRKFLGGCPPDEFRVPEKTNCFYCDECWIAALENLFSKRIRDDIGHEVESE
jgi:hypothetical protein